LVIEVMMDHPGTLWGVLSGGEMRGLELNW